MQRRVARPPGQASPSPRATAKGAARAGGDGVWLREAELARPLEDARAADHDAPVPLLRIVIACVLLGAVIWALTAYGVYSLIAG